VKTNIRTRRIYDPPGDDDGYRALVDRLWPRGIRRDDLVIDEWAKDLAPSTELRKWFHQTPDAFDEFARRYRKELSGAAEPGKALLAAAEGQALTLLYSSRNTEQNHAVVLAEWLRKLK